MILGFTPTPTTLLLNEAPSSRKQQGKKEKPKKERKTQVTARCTKWIMLIRGEKVQDEVLHRAAEEHNSANLKYKQMKSYNATNFALQARCYKKNFSTNRVACCACCSKWRRHIPRRKIPGIGRNSHTCRAMSRSRTTTTTTTTTLDLTHNETPPTAKPNKKQWNRPGLHCKAKALHIVGPRGYERWPLDL